MPTPILQVKDLHTEFQTDGGVVKAVDGVTFDLYPGESIGIVGEHLPQIGHFAHHLGIVSTERRRHAFA